MSRGSEVWKDGYKIHRGTNVRSGLFQGMGTSSQLEFWRTNGPQTDMPKHR